MVSRRLVPAFLCVIAVAMIGIASKCVHQSNSPEMCRTFPITILPMQWTHPHTTSDGIPEASPIPAPHGANFSKDKRPLFGFWLPVGLVGLVSVPPLILLCMTSPAQATTGSEGRVSISKQEEQRLFLFLHVGHTLSAWGDGMWQFALPVLLMDIFQTTLLPAALFALLVYIFTVAGMPPTRGWVDRTSRLKVFSVALCIGNVGICISCILLLLLASSVHTSSDHPAGGVAEEDHMHSATFETDGLTTEMAVLFVLLVLSSTCAQLMNEAQTLTLEKDWIVVLAEGDPELLQQLHTIRRRLDFAAKILAPTSLGVLLQFCMTEGGRPERLCAGVMAVGLFKLAAWPLEQLLVSTVYHNCPRLATKTHALKHVSSSGLHYYGYGGSNQTGSKGDSSELTGMAPPRRPSYNALRHSYSDAEPTCVGAVYTYIRHRVFLASLAYSLLHMTVLDNNGVIITSYLIWRRMPVVVIGASHGAGLILGLVGSALYPTLTRCTKSIVWAGASSLWLYWVLLCPAAVAFAISGESAYSDYTAVGSMVLSRCGLWSFDRASANILQVYVAEDERALVNAMQRSLYQSLRVLTLGMVLYWHDPRDFAGLVGMSITAVLAAAMTYTWWFANQRSESPGFAFSATSARRWRRQPLDEQSYDSDFVRPPSLCSMQSLDSSSSSWVTGVEWDARARQTAATAAAMDVRHHFPQMQGLQPTTADASFAAIHRSYHPTGDSVLPMSTYGTMVNSSIAEKRSDDGDVGKTGGDATERHR